VRKHIENPCALGGRHGAEQHFARHNRVWLKAFYFVKEIQRLRQRRADEETVANSRQDSQGKSDFPVLDRVTLCGLVAPQRNPSPGRERGASSSEFLAVAAVSNHAYLMPARHQPAHNRNRGRRVSAARPPSGRTRIVVGCLKPP
jgi:hypothetical protein